MWFDFMAKRVELVNDRNTANDFRGGQLTPIN